MKRLGCLLLFCLVLRGYSLQTKKDDQFEVNKEGPAIVKRTAVVENNNDEIVMVCTVRNSTNSTSCEEDTSGTTWGTENEACNKTNGRLLIIYLYM